MKICKGCIVLVKLDRVTCIRIDCSDCNSPLIAVRELLQDLIEEIQGRGVIKASAFL